MRLGGRYMIEPGLSSAYLCGNASWGVKRDGCCMITRPVHPALTKRLWARSIKSLDWNKTSYRERAKGSAMPDKHPRLTREDKTVAAMIRLHCCSLHHAPNGLCPDCRELLAYARERLSQCPYQAGKTTCARCLIHCYKPAMREKVRAAMGYAGPRMMYRHPLLALYHLIDGIRKEPSKPVPFGDDKGRSAEKGTQRRND